MLVDFVCLDLRPISAVEEEVGFRRLVYNSRLGFAYRRTQPLLLAFGGST